MLLSFRSISGQTSESAEVFSLGALNEKATRLVMPKLPNVQPRVAGKVEVAVEIDLQKGEVVSATAVSGHPLLRAAAVEAARKTRFAPVLEGFDTLYGKGILTYKVEDFTGRTILNKDARPVLPVIRGGIINGKAADLKKPVYSKEARAGCAAGKVEVLTLVNNWTGKVAAAKAVAGDELLFEASEKAVKETKFSPSNIDGPNDFYVIGRIVYNFDPFARKCVDGGVLNRKALKLPKPVINPDVKIRRESTVRVRVVVDGKGNIIFARVIGELHPLLRYFFETAARQAKFSPTPGPGDILVKGVIIYRIRSNGEIEN
ncbi:MAG: hypothetical protein JSS81_04435 [Acidobacteria bacterium]|nr:hypothetical protein [Acidobacteriota bacterium]